MAFFENIERLEKHREQRELDVNIMPPQTTQEQNLENMIAERRAVLLEFYNKMIAMKVPFDLEKHYFVCYENDGGMNYSPYWITLVVQENNIYNYEEIDIDIVEEYIYPHKKVKKRTVGEARGLGSFNKREWDDLVLCMNRVLLGYPYK